MCYQAQVWPSGRIVTQEEVSAFGREHRNARNMMSEGYVARQTGIEV